MDNPVVIQFQGVRKSYGDRIVLKEINFEVRKGEFITVIGSSGCGKTTMLKLINGLLTPDRGTVYVYGEDVSKTNQIELRRRIGYVIQGVGLFPHMSVRKNIEFVPSILKYDKKKSNKIARDLIRVVGLEEDMLERYPSELSGGQKQRVGVARALAASPEILLMDEPFGAVDEITRTMLQDELLKVHKKLDIAIFFITHDIREAVKLGNRMIVMNDGEIISSGTPEEVINNHEIEFVKSLSKK